MKLAIFGATGATGQRLVLQALDAGHQILAIARNPQKFLPDILENNNFSHVDADIFSSESISGHLDGIDAVLSCLGAYWSLKMLPFCSLDFYLRSMLAIIEAMKLKKIRRLIVMTVWCTEFSYSYPLYAQLIWTGVLGRFIKDMRDMEKHIESESHSIDWTVVRPCILTPKSRADFIGENDRKDAPLDVIENGFIVPNKSYSEARISRSMVAAFMLKCLLDSENTMNKSFAICAKVIP